MSRFPSVQAVIVDLDGTMVDTMGDFTAALNRMLAELSLPALGQDCIEPMVGKGSEHLVRSVLEYLLLPQATGMGVAQDVDQLFPLALCSYQQHYQAINGQHSTVYPGVYEGLDALCSRGLQLACLTNKPGAFARPLLAAKRLDGFFSHVFGGEAFERKKPDPLPLIKTCDALGCVNPNVLMVGDSSNDAQAARAAGNPVALVTYGYNHGKPVRAVDADVFVDSLVELVRLL